jgi:hypothetical protein
MGAYASWTDQELNDGLASATAAASNSANPPDARAAYEIMKADVTAEINSRHPFMGLIGGKTGLIILGVAGLAILFLLSKK